MNSENTLPDIDCVFCGAPLVTENELLNCLCTDCHMAEQTQEKIDNFDDVAFACRGILTLSDVVSEDIRSGFRPDWDIAIHRLCLALHSSQSLCGAVSKYI